MAFFTMKIDVNEFNIVKKCDGNGVNKIYIVQHKESKEYMVLKKIKIENLSYQMKEIEVHRKLNHKYVVKLLKYEVQDDYIVLLVEFAKYGDLFQFIKKTGRLEHRKLLKFYYKIVQSVYYLHSHKFVHRDIKPENIMVSKNFRPLLGDFGASGR